MNLRLLETLSNLLKSILVIALFSLNTLSAQSLKESHVIERSSDGTTVVQASNEYPDNAMVIVYSALRGLDFRSSVGAINQQRYNERASRYEILISPQRQILFVSSNGYIESRLSLVNPNPKEVFYFEVEERKGQDETNVIFLVEPEDAKLFIDNIPMGINKTVSAPLGNVILRLEKPGYRQIEQNIIISKEQVNYSFKMEKVELQVVRFNSNVEGARILIDDVEIAETDVSKGYSHFMNPGIYTVAISKRMYKTVVQTIEVREKANESDNVFTLNLEKNVGTINLTYSPEDAIVEINKQRYTAKNVELIPGKYQVEIRKDGYKPFLEVVEVKQNEKTELNVNLEPYVGSMMFTSKPTNAKAELRSPSGKVIKKWEGLQILNDIPVGRYVVVVSLSGFNTSERNIEIKRDERIEITVELSEMTAASQDKTTIAPSKKKSKPSFSTVSSFDYDSRYSLHFDLPLGFSRTTLTTYDYHEFVYNPADADRYISSQFGFQEQSKNSIVVPYNISLEMEFRIYDFYNSSFFDGIFLSVEPFFSSFQNYFFDDVKPLDYPELKGGEIPNGNLVTDVDTLFNFLFENAFQLRRWGTRIGIRPIPQVQLLFPIQYVGFQYQHRIPCLSCQDNRIEAGTFNLGYGVKLGHRFGNGIGIYGYWESWSANFTESINPSAEYYTGSNASTPASASSSLLGFEFQIPVYNNHLTIKYENPRISAGMEGAFDGLENTEPTNVNTISMHYWQLRYTINFLY